MATNLINSKPTINFNKFDKDNSKKEIISKQIRKFVSNGSQIKSGSLYLDKNPKYFQKTNLLRQESTDFYVKNAYSPAITTTNYRKNFYVSQNKHNKEYLTKYQEYQVPEPDQNALNDSPQNPYDNGLVYNEKTGIAVDHNNSNMVTPMFPSLAASNREDSNSSLQDYIFLNK